MLFHFIKILERENYTPVFFKYILIQKKKKSFLIENLKITNNPRIETNP